MGVRADVLPADTDVHHILIEEWGKMEEARGTLFVSMPSLWVWALGLVVLVVVVVWWWWRWWL